LLNCTDENGINVTLSNGHFRAFNTRTVDGFLTPGLPNRWSVRYPANNISSIDVDYPAYGKILRALGRNEGYWYDLLNYNLSLNNDTFSYAVNDGIYGRFKINSTGSTTALTNYTGIVEMVFRQNIYLSYESMVAELKKEYTISTTDRLLVQFLDYETVRQSGNYSIRHFINLNNTGSTARTQLIYYCNKTYTSGAFSTSPYCVLLDSLSVANVNTRVFFDRNSSYDQIQYSSINGKIDGITATDLGYIGFVMSGNAPIANRFKMKYMNGSVEDVNMTFAQTKVAWTSTDSGTTWSQANWTPDMFLTTNKKLNDEFDFGVYVEDLYGNAYLNLSIIRDTITDTIHPISNPFIQQYNSTLNPSDTDKNGTHTGLMYILIDPAISPDYENGNVTHNLTLRNLDGTVNRTILVWNTTGPQPVWILFNTTSVPNGLYRTNVSAYPLNNFNDVKSYMTSDNFTINNMFVLYLDGVNASRWYEFGTTASIFTTFDKITIFDDVNNISNYTVQNYLFYYPLDALRKIFTKPYLNNSDVFNVTLFENMDVLSVDLQVASNNYTNNLSLNFAYQKYVFSGALNKTNLSQNTFIFGNDIYYNTNISFASAESKTIYINFSSQGVPTRTGLFNLTLTGYAQDIGNAFNYNPYFWQNVNNTDVTKLGTWYPIGNITRPYPPNANTWELFLSNITNIYWVSNYPEALDFASEKPGTTCDRVSALGQITNHCLYVYLADGESPSPLIYSNFVDWNDLDYATAQITLTTNPHKGYMCMKFTDLTNSITITCTPYSGTPGSEENLAGNMTWNRTGTDTWNFHSVGNAAGNIDSTINTATLSRPYYLSFSDPDITGGSVAVMSLNYGGIYLNKTNMSFSGKEGTSGFSHSGNFTTHILNITPSNITRATLTYTAKIPTGASVTAYLSNNDTDTFELVTNGESHLFVSKGNKIRARFVLNSTYNYTSPIITRYSVQVESTAFTGLQVDIGADGVNEFVFGTLNSTTSPIGIGNDTQINSYIFDTCNYSETCAIPIKFNSLSSGLLGLSGLKLIEPINPIKVRDVGNYTTLVQYTSGYNVNLSYLFNYAGNKNITVMAQNPASGLSINNTIKVVYSKYNLTYPNGIDVWEIYPRTRVQSNIQPYGQNSTDGIWRFQAQPFHFLGFDIYTRLNQSIDSCVTRINISGRNMQTSTDYNLTYTATGQILYDNITSAFNQQSWTYTDINCTNTSKRVIIPYFCFYSMCKDCVRTFDYTKCGYEE
jgi:hypothetical protein